LQVETLENLEIPTFLGEEIRNAQVQASVAAEYAKDGLYAEAVAAARSARKSAEIAQSHYSIASHHSYPTQHKIALYLPLFAPLSLPLLVALKREVQRTVLRWKSSIES
jgi:GPI-anchor transamidase subunit S